MAPSFACLYGHFTEMNTNAFLPVYITQWGRVCQWKNDNWYLVVGSWYFVGQISGAKCQVPSAEFKVPRPSLLVPACILQLNKLLSHDIFVLQAHKQKTRYNHDLQTRAADFSENFIFFIVSTAAICRQLTVYNRRSWCNHFPISKREEFFSCQLAVGQLIVELRTEN